MLELALDLCELIKLHRKKRMWQNIFAKHVNLLINITDPLLNLDGFFIIFDQNIYKTDSFKHIFLEDHRVILIVHKTKHFLVKFDGFLKFSIGLSLIGGDIELLQLV
jgi:hypothetical protein